MTANTPRFETVPTDAFGEVWMYVATLAAILCFVIWQALRHRKARSAEAMPAIPNARKSCRWIKADTREQLTEWHCKNCGVEAFSHDGRPPKECKKVLKGPGL